jgi:peptidase E
MIVLTSSGLNSKLEYLGLNVELFDVEFQDSTDLLEYDVILINGGNPFYLIDHFNKSKLQKCIFEIY